MNESCRRRQDERYGASSDADAPSEVTQKQPDGLHIILMKSVKITQKEEGSGPPLSILSPALPNGSDIGHRLICDGHKAMMLVPVKQLIQRINIVIIVFVSFSQ